MRRFLCAQVVVVLVASTATSATVSYQGTMYDLFGQPIPFGLVVAGTFKPGFDVSTYGCTYGDNFCNVYEDHFSRAVADGNFIPFDAGVLTNGFGQFSGTETTNAVGQKIYVYGFPGSQPVSTGLQALLYSSSNSSYIVPVSGSTTALASQANQFVFGASFNNGVRMGILPFPEPSTVTLFALSALALTTWRQQRT